jgi:hypothetical protein
MHEEYAVSRGPQYSEGVFPGSVVGNSVAKEGAAREAEAT